MSATWTSDYTAVPWVSSTSRSGTVAGQASVRVLFTPPPNCVGATIKKLLVHEQAGHVPDLGGDNLNTPMTWAPSLGQWDYGLAWQTHAGHHNSPYTLTAQVTYQVISFFPPPPHPTSYTTPDTTITLTPANLTITPTSPANPEPILWDPRTMPSVTLSASASCAYRQEQPLTLAIYRSDQTLVKTMQQMLVVGPGSVPVQFAWDGSQDPPAVGIAPKGVYLFRWTLGGMGQTPPATDSDKSALLGVTQTSFRALAFERESGRMTLQGRYVLTDGAPRRDASEAQMRIYGPDLALAAGPAPGSVLTNVEGEPVPTWDTAELQARLTDPGAYVFLFAARDGHDSEDRAHRQRWALQRNQAPSKPPALNVEFAAYPQPPPETTVPYGDRAAGSQGAPSLQEASRDLGYAPTVSTNATAASTLALLIKRADEPDRPTDRALFFVFGHGGDALQSAQQFWTGAQWSYLVQHEGARAWLTQRGKWNADSVWLDDPAIPSNAFRRVLLGVLLGCYTAYDNATWGSPTSGLIAKGAHCAIGWTKEIRPHGVDPVTGVWRDGAEEWAEHFWYWACVEGRTVGEAATKAYNGIPVSQGLRSYKILFRRTDGSVEEGKKCPLKLHPARWGSGQ